VKGALPERDNALSPLEITDPVLVLTHFNYLILGPYLIFVFFEELSYMAI
jgi:hypothetical protein